MGTVPVLDTAVVTLTDVATDTVAGKGMLTMNVAYTVSVTVAVRSYHQG